MPKKYLLAAALLCAASPQLAAREVNIGVDSLLQLVAAGNADVRTARSRVLASEQGVAVARAARLPQITASLDLNYLGDGTILDRDFSHAMRDKLPHFGNTLSVNLYQPLYQGGAITTGIRMARQQTDLAAVGLTQQTDASSVQAIDCYLNLLKMHNLRKVYVENIDITRQLIAQMTEHFNHGTALRNDITRYELRLSSLEYDLLTIDNSISVLNCDLSSLAALPEGSVVVPDHSLAETAPAIGSEEQWQQLALTHSSELKALDITRDITLSSIRLDKASTLPSVGIVIGDHLAGPVTFEIPAIDKNYNAWYAGVSLSYNFSSLYTANKKIRQKQQDLLTVDHSRSAVEEALQRRVHQAWMAAVQARQMLDTETVNVRLANENYQVVQTRFDNDMALLTDMLDASTAKLDAETRLVNARVSLLQSFYQLKYITGTLTH